MKLLIPLVFVLFANLGTCQSQEVKKFKDESDVPRITVEEAKKAFDENNVVIVDSRAADAYNQEHIKGAVNIPNGSPNSEFDKLPKGKKIIVYCS